MKRKLTILLLLTAAAGIAFAKPKHPSLSEVFATARTVHVEARSKMSHGSVESTCGQDSYKGLRYAAIKSL